ncbi:hypothetical protein IX293_002237 [Fusobacterium necrophorum]|nr:hypothetical protein [Fusobacterium necrophorum]
MVEDIRHSEGMRELYSKRSETIERVFADGKELHGLRYTQYRGLEKVKMELTLQFACMNLKKLAIWKARKGLSTLKSFLFFANTRNQLKKREVKIIFNLSFLSTAWT